jgi:hypothetical protein
MQVLRALYGEDDWSFFGANRASMRHLFGQFAEQSPNFHPAKTAVPKFGEQAAAFVLEANRKVRQRGDVHQAALSLEMGDAGALNERHRANASDGKISPASGMQNNICLQRYRCTQNAQRDDLLRRYRSPTLTHQIFRCQRSSRDLLARCAKGELGPVAHRLAVFRAATSYRNARTMRSECFELV